MEATANLNSDEIIFAQIHVGLTVTDNSDCILVLDINKSANCIGNHKFTKYNKYFLQSHGHIANVYQIKGWPNAQYLQAYETSSHIVPSHNNFHSLFGTVLTSQHKSFGCNNEEILSQLEEMELYVSGIREGPDLRLEVIVIVSLVYCLK